MPIEDCKRHHKFSFIEINRRVRLTALPSLPTLTLKFNEHKISAHPNASVHIALSDVYVKFQQKVFVMVYTTYVTTQIRVITFLRVHQRLG